jgi:hypothetical protein
LKWQQVFRHFSGPEEETDGIELHLLQITRRDDVVDCACHVLNRIAAGIPDLTVKTGWLESGIEIE